MRATFGGIAGHLRQQEQEGKARRERSKSKKAGERSGKSKKIASFLCSFSESDVRRHCRPSQVARARREGKKGEKQEQEGRRKERQKQKDS